MKNNKQTLFITLLQFSLLTIVIVLSLNTNTYSIDFDYINGTAGTGYTYKGAPTNMIDVSDDLPNDVLTNIYSMLPESQYVNPAYIDNDLLSNIVVDEDFTGVMTVDVTFLNEGAGYRNTFGYFIYDPSNPPDTIDDISAHVIIFPNSSKPPEGEMVQGDNVDLYIQLVAGEALGFFVIPNGWGWSGSYGYVNSLGPWNQPFYSLPSLNPENADLQAHNVIFYDALNAFFVIGFDDQKRTQGDNDFNDILVSVVATPYYAVEGINLDGSVDANTYQVLGQSNAAITSTSYYPSQLTSGTLLYEDLWPQIGDYDFNDLVVSYQIKHILNHQNKLIEMEFSYQIQAIGASFHNGFALHLPSVAASNIASSTLTTDGVITSHDILDPNNTEANFVLLEDAWDLTTTGCGKYRTDTGCLEDITTNFVATITFNSPVDLSSLGDAPYDPYIFAIDDKYHGVWNGRGWEVHLKQFSGSELFDLTLLGQAADSSTDSNNFVSAKGFPWAINLPTAWNHPSEGTDILEAYPLFSTWVKSSGNSESNWHKRSNADLNKLYE